MIACLCSGLLFMLSTYNIKAHNRSNHGLNLSNNIWGGGGGNRPWVLGTLIYEELKLE
jgi:hypothetical protein